jgi:methylenetetrahydrofolate reductase (NADPH)
MTLRSKLESGKLAVTCEFGPVKGTETHELHENIEILRDKVDAANVTDQQSSIMRMSAFATALMCVQGGLEPIYQMTCRDRNRIAIQADLLGAWTFGVRNVLALTGDLPQLGDQPMAKPVFDLDSVTLLQTISTLNSGKDLSGIELKGKTSFFPGAVVKVENNTEASFELQIHKFQKKVVAGAKFFQTQACYDPKSFEKLMRRVDKFGVPVMVGVIPLKNAGSAKYMNANVAGIHVPDELIDIMAKASKEDREKVGIEMAADLIKKMKGMCQGVHIMAVAWEKKVPEIMALAGL